MACELAGKNLLLDEFLLGNSLKFKCKSRLKPVPDRDWL